MANVVENIVPLPILIRVGRMLVTFTCRANEHIYQDGPLGLWIAEYRVREMSGTRQAPVCETKWVRLGAFESEAVAAKALYLERAEFSASYGCDAAAGID